MTSITQTLQSLQIAEPQRHKGLAVFPLLWPGLVADPPAYLTLEEAVRQGTARVTEVSESGSVPELRLTNDGAAPVLLLGGEELVGAKQNRILNLTVLAPGKATMKIPVSCVEAGRWSMRSPEFEPSKRVMPRAMRARVNEQVSRAMRTTGSRRPDQSEVWDMIAMQAASLGASSPTSAMADTFEKASLSLEDLLRPFQALDGQAGILYCLGGRHWGVDVFDHPATLRHYYPKLLRSYGLDALQAPSGAATREEAEAFLQRMGAANAHIEPAIGLGKDVRLVGEGVGGAGLDWEERYVHLCGFGGASEADPGGFETRMTSVRHRIRW